MKQMTIDFDLIMKALAYCAVNSTGAFSENCRKLHSELLLKERM